MGKRKIPKPATRQVKATTEPKAGFTNYVVGEKQIEMIRKLRAARKRRKK